MPRASVRIAVMVNAGACASPGMRGVRRGYGRSSHNHRGRLVEALPGGGEVSELPPGGVICLVLGQALGSQMIHLQIEMRLKPGSSWMVIGDVGET